MSTVEPTAGDVFVGLENAETQLPERWLALRDRLQSAAVVGVVLAVQLGWLAAFGYAAYRFIF